MVPAFNNNYQVLMYEMMALQAFYSFEGAMEEVAAKILCGARYVDGAVPVLTHPQTATLDDALTAMRTVGRTKPKGIMWWNRSAEIRENVKYVIDSNENFCAMCIAHGAAINDMRVVRNHIAHNSKGTRQEYVQVVSSRLGGRPTKVPRPGAFLLQKFGAVILIEEYVVSLEAILKAVVKA